MEGQRSRGRARGRLQPLTVTMSFKALDDGRTLVEIAEEGWHETPGALKAQLRQLHGLGQMLAALKVWVEHGINLREGMYK